MPHGPKVLILDTVADVFFGNENNRSSVNAFIKTVVGRMSRQHNATVVFISHPSKMAGSQWSGSTAWNNGVRNRIFMSWLDPKDQSKYRTIQNAKANYSAVGGKILLAWDRGVLVPVEEEEVQALWDAAVLEAITTAAEAGNPYLATYHGGSRFIGKASIIVSGDKKLSKEKILAAVDNLICDKKIHNVTGKSEGNGLFPSAHDPNVFSDSSSHVDEESPIGGAD